MFIICCNTNNRIWLNLNKYSYLELCDVDAGWVYYKGSDHCYRYFDHEDYDGYADRFWSRSEYDDIGITHSEAESSCANEGGHLFSPNNVEEMRFVQTNILMYVYLMK